MADRERQAELLSKPDGNQLVLVEVLIEVFGCDTTRPETLPVQL